MPLIEIAKNTTKDSSRQPQNSESMHLTCQPIFHPIALTITGNRIAFEGEMC